MSVVGARVGGYSYGGMACGVGGRGGNQRDALRVECIGVAN